MVASDGLRGDSLVGSGRIFADPQGQGRQRTRRLVQGRSWCCLEDSCTKAIESIQIPAPEGALESALYS